MDIATRKKLIQQISDLPSDLKQTVAGLSVSHINGLKERMN